MAAVAESEGIPLISPSSTNPATTQGKRYVFRVAFVDSFQGQAIARFVSHDLEARRAAVLYDVASAYNRDLAEFFQQQFEADGGQVVAFESYTTDEQDWSRQLAVIQECAPEVLFLPNYTTEVLSQVRQARQMAITATLVGGDAWSSFAPVEWRELDGAYYSTHWSPDITSEPAQAFIEAYRRTYGYVPTSQNAALTYDAFGLLFQAIQTAGKTDPESIRYGLSRTTRYAGVTGSMAYHGTGDPSRSIVILKIRAGEPVFYKQMDP
ncbi:MAG: ABC transporter substrate-binding protein [Chloroflexaceae bacterium]|nr:ABC transporter substrate-binding protein [Chloroflexaceae bacterium]